MTEFKIIITGNTDPVEGPWHEVSDFVIHFAKECDYFPNSYNLEVDFEEKPREPVYYLNDNVDKKCYIDGGVIRVRDSNNTYAMTIDGFPVGLDGDRGVYILHAEVFNDLPKDWVGRNGHRAFEEHHLAPWLRSMGFSLDGWVYGSDDGFGFKRRIALLKRNKNKFEFIYG